MKIKIFLFLGTFIAVQFVFISCNDTHNESTETTEVSNQCINDSTAGNLHIMSFTSDKRYFNEKQEEICPKLDSVINSGKYNITSVKTSYSEGYLTSADILYVDSCWGEGNNLRVVFVHSNEYYWGKKEAELKPRLDSVVNRGGLNVVKVQTTRLQGRLLAAEVYYRLNN